MSQDDNYFDYHDSDGESICHDSDGNIINRDDNIYIHEDICACKYYFQNCPIFIDIKKAFSNIKYNERIVYILDKFNEYHEYKYVDINDVIIDDETIKLHTDMTEQSDFKAILLLLRGKYKNALHLKNNKFVHDVSCTSSFFKKWIEYQFDLNMNLNNYGIYWCIDHVNPVCNFDIKNLENIYKCNHWSNLRPFENKKNLKKGGKIIPFELLKQEIIVCGFKKLIHDLFPFNFDSDIGRLCLRSFN